MRAEFEEIQRERLLFEFRVVAQKHFFEFRGVAQKHFFLSSARYFNGNKFLIFTYMKNFYLVWRHCLLMVLVCFICLGGHAQLTELEQGKVYRFVNRM